MVECNNQFELFGTPAGVDGVDGVEEVMRCSRPDARLGDRQRTELRRLVGHILVTRDRGSGRNRGNRQIVKEAKPFIYATRENAGIAENTLTGLITRRS